jgi:hypothetical protein
MRTNELRQMEVNDLCETALLFSSFFLREWLKGFKSRLAERNPRPA